MVIQNMRGTPNMETLTMGTQNMESQNMVILSLETQIGLVLITPINPLDQLEILCLDLRNLL